MERFSLRAVSVNEARRKHQVKRLSYLGKFFRTEDFPKTTRAKLEAGRLKLLDELALLFGQRLWELDVDFDV